MNALCELHCMTGLYAGTKDTQTLGVSFETMINLVSNTSFFLRRCFEYRVRRYVIDEMLPKIGSKISETFVTERLYSTDNSRCVNVVTFRHFAGRQEESLLMVVQNFPDQSTSRTTQRGLGKTHLKRGQERLGAI